MTLALRDLQAAFADLLLAPESDSRPDIGGEILGGRFSAEARLRIHRHHVLNSLARVLGGTFPTVVGLIGDDFFAGMARAFVVAEPPAQPVLAEYGAGFPGFIERYGPARDLPYLADAARLDWALNVAFNSPFGSSLEARGLAEIPAEELPARNLPLASGVALLESIYPLDRIWKVARSDASAGQVDLDAGPVRLLIHRLPDDAGFVALGEAEMAFLSTLGRGASLEQATEAAFGQDAGFDLSGSFPRFLALGVFAAVQ